MDQNSIIRSLAFVLGVVLLIAVSWGAIKAVTEAKADYNKTDIIETLDTDVALVSTIDSLEAHWNRRMNYHFDVQQDPLFIGRVIIDFSYAEQGFMEFEESDDLRLTATVTIHNDIPMAIIKCEGKSLVLHEGDKFGKDYVLKEIKEKRVIVYRKGEKITLYNKSIKVPEEEFYQHSSAQSNEW